jgi:hypothetical protein
MRHQWLAYVIVALLSIGAGVAIAGLPNDVPVDAVIIVPSTTEVPETTIATTTTAPPDTTTPPETTVATTDVPTTEAPATTEPGPTTTTTIPLPDRDEISVATANGAGTQGAASRVADQLEGLGYVGVQLFDGSDIVDFTIVYYINGFEEAAARMAADLDLLPQFIAPISEAPEVPGLVEVELLAYVGIDRG